MQNNRRLIIMYDFDKTLATQYMSEFKLIPDAGYTDPNKFWAYCDVELAKKYNLESNIAFLYGTFLAAKNNKIKITKQYLQDAGKSVKFFPGVVSWFDRINQYGKSRGLQVEHYVISSGIFDVIMGTKIAPKLNNVFASSFAFDKNGEAFWPSVVVNYTTKTQYIFRLRKNSRFEVYDDASVNEKIKDDKLVVPWANMIYVGDGSTDIPSMEIVKNKGGNSICVYANGHKDYADRIIEDDRVNYIAKANYSVDSDIDRVVKSIIDKISDRVVK